MGRTAKALVHGDQIITIETDLSGSIKNEDDLNSLMSKTKDLAPDLWDYTFGYYFVDDNGRLVYLYEPIGKMTDALIFTIASDLHPSAEEKFDTVEIIDEDTGKLLNTIHNADLIGILQAVKEVMER